jgi:hypothetical protein
MNEAELKRLRSSIVSTLFFADGLMPVTDLRRDLERTHGIVVTAVQIRAALIWLEQMNLVRHRDDRATLTEAGQDVGALRTPFPD